jgi:FSR family fosmidomycin resistance protein-like MFS transporter
MTPPPPEATAIAAAPIAPADAPSAAAAMEVDAHARTRPTRLAGRIGMVITAHGAVDFYSAIFAPLLGVLQVRCDMQPHEAAWLLGLGALTSGISQPLCAWLSDKIDSRIFGAAGLALAAMCLSFIGAAHSIETLIPLYVIGTLGIGIFHPTGAASVGQLADHLPGRRRSLGVSVFFCAGMAGSLVGSLVASSIANHPERGFDLLRWLTIPGVLLALALHASIRRVPHRHHGHGRAALSKRDIGQRWASVGILYVSNVLRGVVNTALIYIIVRWSEAAALAVQPDLTAREVAQAGGRTAGTINAVLVIGMAGGGLLASAMTRNGREKWPLVVVPIVLAPSIALFGYSGGWQAYVLALLAGASFASMVPVTVSLAQRLLPHRTTLASGIMLGAAWAVASVGPRIAEYCLSGLNLSIGLTATLWAIVLGLSGLVCLPLSRSLLERASTPRGA